MSCSTTKSRAPLATAARQSDGQSNGQATVQSNGQSNGTAIDTLSAHQVRTFGSAERFAEAGRGGTAEAPSRGKVLLAIGDAAEATDTLYPWMRLMEAGYECVVAAPDVRSYQLVLHERPEVEACAVVGLPDERLGERVAVAVQLRAGATVGEDELRQHCLANLAKYKVPERWLFVDGFPRNSMGKIQRRDLPALFS